MPLLDEIRNNASLILSNSHVSTGLPESLPQNVIPIAGFHINSNVELLPDVSYIVSLDCFGFGFGTQKKFYAFPSRIGRGHLVLTLRSSFSA